MKVKLITLGCPKNLVDSEKIAGELQRNGFRVIDNGEPAEIAILNTCGFIDAAKAESIEAILEAVAAKRAGRFERVFVTGCLSQRYGETLRREIPELDGVFGNRDPMPLLRAVNGGADFRHELIGERFLFTPHHFAYLKISEGCEHPCTFCAIPQIRGRFRSRPMPELVAEAKKLAARGVREIILIAQDSTIYGHDLNGARQLPQLLRALCRVEGIEWIRLMYAYPLHVTDELIETIATEKKICKYLDMPMQHVSSRMLKRMARKMDRDRLFRLIETLRAEIPHLALRTSVIVGFPGETDSDFEELLAAVGEGYFDRLGVFTFSAEEGTPAATFPEQIPGHIMRERQALLLQTQANVAEEKNAALIGRELRVFIDEIDEDGVSLGRTEWDCPEIDHVVRIERECERGAFYRTKIRAADAHELVAGEIAPETQPEPPVYACAHVYGCD